MAVLDYAMVKTRTRLEVASWELNELRTYL